MRTAYVRGRRQLVAAQTVASNDIGEFRVGELKPGQYLIGARPLIPASGPKTPGDAPEPGYTTTFYPGATDAAGAVPVDLAMGAELRGTDIRLLKTRTVRVKGRLAGVPEGARPMVSLLPAGPGATFLGSSATAAAAPPDWTFELKGLAPGSYMLTAVAAAGAEVLGGSMPIEVGDQHIDGVVLSVNRKFYTALPGTIVLAGNGSAADLKGARVSLEPAEAAGSGFSSEPAGGDGKFTVRPMAGRRYSVRVFGGPQTAYVKSVRWGSQDVTEQGLDLTGGVGGNLQITLSAAGAKVEGSVRGQEDKPVAGATVGIAPGEYKLLAWEEIEPGAFEDPEFVKPLLSKAQALSLKENDYKSCSMTAIAPEKD